MLRAIQCINVENSDCLIKCEVVNVGKKSWGIF